MVQPLVPRRVVDLLKQHYQFLGRTQAVVADLLGEFDDPQQEARKLYHLFILQVVLQGLDPTASAYAFGLALSLLPHLAQGGEDVEQFVFAQNTREYLQIVHALGQLLERHQPLPSRVVQVDLLQLLLGCGEHSLEHLLVFGGEVADRVGAEVALVLLVDVLLVGEDDMAYFAEWSIGLLGGDREEFEKLRELHFASLRTSLQVYDLNVEPGLPHNLDDPNSFKELLYLERL